MRGWVSLGYITIVAGTPVRITANMSSSVQDKEKKVRALMFQATKANTKQCWVQDSSTAVGANGLIADSTGGVLALIAVPVLTAGQPTALPSVSPGQNDPSFSAFDLAQLWLDGENSGDKVLVSYLP